MVPETDSPVLQSPVVGLGTDKEQTEERAALQLLHTGTIRTCTHRSHTHIHTNELTKALDLYQKLNMWFHT